MNKDAKIYIAGHAGLVGSAIIRRLESEGYSNLITRHFQELDLRNQQAVYRFFEIEKPEYVFLAAAKVGGILANMTYPADFIYDNLMIELNVIDAAYKFGVKKLLFLGSSCIYPRNCPQPIKEEYLLTNTLEKTNEPYAIAKIAGISLCQSYNKQYGTNFISCMPTNLYGPGDNFHLQNSHVMPALIKKIYTAHKENKNEVIIWGTGKPYREFLYVDDLADAVIYLMETYTGQEPINIGTGKDITIANLAYMIADVIGYKGKFIFDTSKPDGTLRKLLAINRLTETGWHASTSLQAGISKTIAWCIEKNIFDSHNT
jgi:GDP-L-fucose synthase